jgi:hypothetical protein
MATAKCANFGAELNAINTINAVTDLVRPGYGNFIQVVTRTFES